MPYNGTQTTTTTNPMLNTPKLCQVNGLKPRSKISATYIVSQYCWRQKILPKFEVNETLSPHPFSFCAEFPLTHRCASYTRKK